MLSDKRTNLMQYRLKMAEERNAKFFDRPSKEWAFLVINNRNRDYRNFSDLECNHDRKYDLVIGPVADDDLALLFRQFSGGLINADVLVEAMKFKKLTNRKRKTLFSQLHIIIVNQSDRAGSFEGPALLFIPWEEVHHGKNHTGASGSRRGDS